MDSLIDVIDDTTNMIMDKVRDTFKLDSDSDTDDALYSYIHTTISNAIYEVRA